ncbi:twin-arginine translocase subunit TatC [uncultured Thiohalocapsa sp.]|uniref:twin-arginine translocase subunit TatC n=1 Tax=uncultured Thiohalocapsa sp. TaxID=768990 RepID=UPI0025CCECF8|nr:twin-arginine translocase subunit TatC [uncultured Thiohalocapsa sp.]
MNPQQSQDHTDDGLGGEQPFMSHLTELRDRLLRMVIAIVVVFLVLFPFANEIYTFIAGPIRAQLPEGSQMIATQVASPFLTPFKLALVAAVFVAMPYLLYQFWAFVAPGLYTHEKRLALPLVSSSIVLFYLGMAFAYFVVFPLVFRFFTAVTPEGVAQMPDIAFYLEFVLKLFFAFGVAFEIPIATILLVAVGATTPKALAQKRPYVIVGVFVAGMLLTPPDVVSQTLLAIPMWLLFEAGIFFSRWFDKRQPAATPALAPESGADGAGMSRNDSQGDGRPTPGPAGGAVEVGREIDGGQMEESGRYRPMTEEEMEAELDAIEAEEAADAAAPVTQDSAQARIEALLRSANERRAEGDTASARTLLYLVLEEGDADQRRVARNILADLDQD